MSDMSRVNRHTKNGNYDQFYEQNEKKGTQSKPPKAPRKKKKGKFKKFLLLLLFIILLFVGYSIFSYYKGLNTAKNDTSIPKIEVSEFQGSQSNDGSINILLLGSDSRGEDQGRSDTIMVAHYNKKTRVPQLISFMRDSFVTIPGYEMNKINAAYSYGGAELVRQTLKENFDIDVQYYAIVNFESFPKIIDTLCPNGVEIDAEKDINLDGVDISKGKQKMDGYTLLQYARFRKDEEGDFGRVRRQQQSIEAVSSQMKGFGSLIHLPEAIGTAQGYTSTNIPTSVIAEIGTDFALGRLKPIERLTIPVENSWFDNYYDYAGSVLELDFDQNKQAIQNFLK